MPYSKKCYVFPQSIFCWIFFALLGFKEINYVQKAVSKYFFFSFYEATLNTLSVIYCKDIFVNASFTMYFFITTHIFLFYMMMIYINWSHRFFDILLFPFSLFTNSTDTDTNMYFAYMLAIYKLLVCVIYCIVVVIMLSMVKILKKSTWNFQLAFSHRFDFFTSSDAGNLF